MTKNQQSKISSRNTRLQSKISFGKFPAIIYVSKWLLISPLIGICVGSVSAGFIQSLNWATDFREDHLWLMVFLPLGGLLLGLIYNYLGKDFDTNDKIKELGETTRETLEGIKAIIINRDSETFINP